MRRLKTLASLARPRQVRGIVGAAVVFLTGCGPTINRRPRDVPNPPPTVPGVSVTSLSLSALADLHNRVSPERALNMAKDSCIDFFVDHEAELELREKRVRDDVIEELKSACVDLSSNMEEQAARRQREKEVGPDAAAEEYFAIANAYMRVQRFGAAEGEIREAIRLFRNNGTYYHLLGMAAYRQRRCVLAAAAFETALQLGGIEGYVGYGYAGHCFQLRDEGERAYVAYQRAFAYAPTPDWRNWLSSRCPSCDGGRDTPSAPRTRAVEPTPSSH